MEKVGLVNFGILSLLVVIAPYLSRFTRIPVVVVEMLLGAFGWYFNVFKDTHAFKVLSEVSFLYLMFLAGMETDLRGFSRLGKVFYRRSFLYFALLYSLSSLTVFLLDLPSIFVIIFPVMSVGVIVTLIRDYGKGEVWLNTVLKTGIMGELLSISALVITNGLYSHDIFSWGLYKTIFALLGFIFVATLVFKIGKVIFWWYPGMKLWFMPSQDSNSQDIRFSMMLFFALTSIVWVLSLELVLGAFLAGMVVATFFSYKKDMFYKLNDVGFGFFVPLFFIHVGSTVDLETVFRSKEIIMNGMYIVIIMFTIRIVSSYISFARFFGNVRNTLLFALSDCMPLTFLVAVASLGLNLNAISNNTYYSCILAAIFEGILFTITIKFIYGRNRHKQG